MTFYLSFFILYRWDLTHCTYETGIRTGKLKSLSPSVKEAGNTILSSGADNPILLFRTVAIFFQP